MLSKVPVSASKKIPEQTEQSKVAGGYVEYHAVSNSYELSPEQAMVLANEDSLVFIPPAWQVPASM